MMKKLIAVLFTGFVCSSCSEKQKHEITHVSTQGKEMTQLYLFQNTEEKENIKLKVKGKIPEWLEGEFIRNGPGIIKDKNGYVKSWFDGLAKLHSFTFQRGEVIYTTKFLKSEAYNIYQSTGEFDFQGFAQQSKTNSFSFIDFMLNIKNKKVINANVNVARINKQLVALTETPLPVVFDKSLNTLGPLDYDDNLPKNYSYESAHILKDPDTQASWNFLIKLGIFETAYQVYTIPHNSQERKLVASIPVSSISYMHSFSLAGRYVVLTDYPLRAKKPRDIGNGFIDAFSWQEKENTIIYVIDKESGKYWTFKTEPFFSFHHINGFEKDGKVCVDLIAYPTSQIVRDINSYPFIKNPDNKLIRLEMNFTDNKAEVKTLSSEHYEFPRLNDNFIGKENQYFYAMYSQEKGNGLIKYNLQNLGHHSWYEEGMYANEPVFVSRPDGQTEDDGVILSVVNDLKSKKSFLLVLSAKDLKEIARVDAPHLIPFGFHGQFYYSSS